MLQTRPAHEVDAPDGSWVGTRVSARIAGLSILGFWSFWLLLVTARAAAMQWPDPWGMALRRCALVAVGMALTWLIHVALDRLGRRSLVARATVAFGLAALATSVFAVLNTFVFYRWFPVPSVAADLARWEPRAVVVTAIADGLVTWFFFFAAWVAFYLAIGHVADVRAAERRAALSSADARTARLAMLRLQVDPHFLFNALNALSAMVAGGRTKPARAMISDLAAFFRAGLDTAPADDVTLAEEIELQRLYLAIEQARFGDRLSVEWRVCDDVREVRIPALILQPLVENAVKHGLARTSRPVRIVVDAHRDDARRIVLSVLDDAGAAVEVPDPAGPRGIGLGNVHGRLAARYGARAWLAAGATANGWRSTVTVPADA